jgi:hypothetical protein
MQGNQSGKETILKKFRSGWLHLSIEAVSYRMTPFLDFILLNKHTTHTFHGYVLCDPTKVTEATDTLFRTATGKILQFLHAKWMTVLSIAGDGFHL